jgi:uncharacterized protein (DUF58 family)
MRPYRRGDHTSSIDWKASARLSAARGTDEFVTREFFAEQAPRVAVVCDRRPGMRLYGDGVPWLDKAAAAGTVIDLLATSTLAERADLAYVDHATERGTWLPPSRSARGPLLANRLTTTPWAGPSDGLHRSLELLARHRSVLPVGTFLFVISDFLAPPPARAWATFRSLPLDVTPVIVQDPTWEQRFPHIRSTVLQVVDPATGRSSDVWIERGERRSRENEDRLRATVSGFVRLGFDPVVIGSSAPEDVHEVFARWAARRRRLRRAVA